jgi:hypothetical protein
MIVNSWERLPQVLYQQSMVLKTHCILESQAGQRSINQKKRGRGDIILKPTLRHIKNIWNVMSARQKHVQEMVFGTQEFPECTQPPMQGISVAYRHVRFLSLNKTPELQQP